MEKKKIIFWLVWLGLVSLGPITAFRITPLASVVDDRTLLSNLLQRILGLVAFSLLFIQIILGAFMPKLIEKLGGWIFRFHIIEGFIIYFLIILHPLAFVFFTYFIGKGLDPFYAFVDVCVLCGKAYEFYYNFGRIGFWLLTIGVASGLARAATPFMRIHWRKFHILNYVAFFSIWLHSLKLGSDIGTPPFSYLHGPTLVIIVGIVLFKLRELLYRH